MKNLSKVSIYTLKYVEPLMDTIRKFLFSVTDAYFRLRFSLDELYVT